MILKLRSKIKDFAKLLQKEKPTLKAEFSGIGNNAPYGTVDFFSISGGVLICAEVFRLPKGTENCAGRFFGFHIHEGTSCTGDSEDPFADTKGHYNPTNCPHPFHKGDLPPLYSADGYSFLCVFKKNLLASEIAGKTIVIHEMPDDFQTQPAGNSGKKIACAMIKKI